MKRCVPAGDSNATGRLSIFFVCFFFSPFFSCLSLLLLPFFSPIIFQYVIISYSVSSLVPSIEKRGAVYVCDSTVNVSISHGYFGNSIPIEKFSSHVFYNKKKNRRQNGVFLASFGRSSTIKSRKTLQQLITQSWRLLVSTYFSLVIYLDFFMIVSFLKT